MNRYDAIIVGAGPAGSTCAAELKKAGLDVKLFDKKVFPRVKPCAGWVTPQVFESLKIDVDEYRRNLTFQPITGFRTGMIGGRLVETNYAEPASYGILRVEFDNFLLQRSGVPCDYQMIKQIRRVNDEWVVNETHSAPLLIGAGGHFCPVARMARKADSEEKADVQKDNDVRKHSIANNAENRLAPVVYAQEIEFEMSNDQLKEQLVECKPELYFCPDLMGYGWCFRKGNFLNIGLGRTQKSDLSSHVESFCDFLSSRNNLVMPRNGRLLGHAYRLYADAPPKLYDVGLVLIGDAAGLAYPQSGEGIRPAVESALIASKVIAEADGKYNAQTLAAYERQMIERFGAAKSANVMPWLPATWLQKLAAGLMATRWFAKRVVIENWFLNRHQKAM